MQMVFQIISRFYKRISTNANEFVQAIFCFPLKSPKSSKNPIICDVKQTQSLVGNIDFEI